MSTFYFSLLFISALMSLACGLRSSLWTAPPLTPAQSSSADPTGAPGSTGPGQFSISLTSANSGLSQLASYRANLIVDFAGIYNGQSSNGRIESLTEVTRQPAALHQYFNIAATIPNPEISSGVSEFFRIGDKVYVKKAGDEPWFTFTDAHISPDRLGFFELDRLIMLPATVSQPPRLETLNGLKVQHYTFDQSDLTDLNIIFERAEGDFWIAPGGNYLVQYVISTSLRIIIPDPKAHLIDSGTLSLRYTLADIKADFTLTPPAQAMRANAALAHLPRLADAEIISIFPTFMEYTSTISAISATLFFRDELTAQGWTEQANSTIFNEKSRLAFSKEDQTVTILIQPAEDLRKIKVLLDFRPP